MTDTDTQQAQQECSCDLTTAYELDEHENWCRTHHRWHFRCIGLVQPCVCEPIEYPNNPEIKWCKTHWRWHHVCVQEFGARPFNPDNAESRAEITADYEACGNCFYWGELGEEAFRMEGGKLTDKKGFVHTGFCYRFPPNVMVDLQGRFVGGYPKTSAASYCGEWRKNEMVERSVYGNPKQKGNTAQ